MTRHAAWLLSMLLMASCSKPEEKTTKDESSEKKKDEDDEQKKKAKKKKGDDEEKKPAADPDDEARKGGDPAPASSDGTRGGDKASVIDPTTPIPPGCVPPDSGKLGQKPRYVTSAGQPGASLAVWVAASDVAMKGPFAMTISADGKCYVHYEKPLMENEKANATLKETKLEKGAIQAVNGVDDKGNTFVGFRVAYTSSWQTPVSTISQRELLFFGYVSAGGVPYSCAPLTGEPKSNACAMYHAPLHLLEKETCTASSSLASTPPVLASNAPSPSASPGPPSFVGPKLKLGGGSGIASAVPVKPGASGSIAPPKIALTAPSAASSAGASDACGPDAECEVKGVLVKETKATYARVLPSGSAKKCNGSRQPIAPHLGDTWYFDRNRWVKR